MFRWSYAALTRQSPSYQLLRSKWSRWPIPSAWRCALDRCQSLVRTASTSTSTSIFWVPGHDNCSLLSLADGVFLRACCLEPCILSCFWGCEIGALQGALQAHQHGPRLSTPRHFQEALRFLYSYCQSFSYPFITHLLVGDTMQVGSTCPSVPFLTSNIQFGLFSAFMRYR